MLGISELGAKGKVSAKIIRHRTISAREHRIRNFFNLWGGLWRVWLAVYVSKITKLPVLYGTLSAELIREDGTRINYGILSHRVVTTAFCADIVDNLQTSASSFATYDFHDCGTGSTAEASGDVALVTPYGGSRATGTPSEPTSVQYQSVGTINFTTTKAVVEHGLFNASTSGTLMDRSVFSALNVVNGDSIQFTYTISMTAGG